MNNSDLVCSVFSFLKYNETKCLSYVCKNWYNITILSNKSYLSEIIYEHMKNNFNELLRHCTTLQYIHVKYIDDLELWLPFYFKQLKYIYFERCNFININNFITPITEYIKLEQCNEQCTNKNSMIPNLNEYPNLKKINVS